MKFIAENESQSAYNVLKSYTRYKVLANGVDKNRFITGLVDRIRNFGLNWKNWVDEIHNSVGSVSKVRQIYMTYSLPANTTDPLIQDYLFSYFETLYGKLPNVPAKTNYGDLNREYLQAGTKNGQSYEIKDNKYVQRIRFDAIGYLDITGIS